MRTVILVLLAFLISAAAAMEREPSTLTWEGGSISRSDAIAWLRSTGNMTTLHAESGSDPVADLPFASGTYWEAVIAVAEAFELEIGPASEYRRLSRPGGTGTGPTQVIGLAGGSLRLSPRGEVAPWHAEESGRRVRPHPYRPAQQLVAKGAMLLEISDAGIVATHDGGRTTANGGITYRLRSEPRFETRLIGPAKITWRRALAADGKELAWAESESDQTSQWMNLTNPRSRAGSIVNGKGRDQTLRLFGMAADSRGFALTGQLEVELLTDLSLSRELVDGAAKVDWQGESWDIQLVDEEAARAQGRHQAYLRLALPNRSRLFGTPALVVRTSAGDVLSRAGSGSYPRGEHWEHLVYLRDLKEGPYTVEVSGQQVVGFFKEDLNLVLHLP